MPGQPYPWAFLERVPRDAVRAARRVRPALDGCAAPAGVVRGLTEILGTKVSFAVRRVVPSALPGPPGALFFWCEDVGLTLALEPDPELATAVVHRALSREPTLTAPRAALHDSIRGALSAIVVEAARRAGSSASLLACAAPPHRAGGLRADLAIFVDGRPYRAAAWATTDHRPLRDSRTEGARAAVLGRLGALPVSLPAIAALSNVPAAELDALAPGDVYLPGKGWFGSTSAAEPSWARLTDTLVLAAPNSERGVTLVKAGASGFRLGPVIPIPAEEDGTVAVRVEIGEVALGGRDWAALASGSGDAPLGELAVEPAPWIALRAAGSVLGRGELVTVSGELGVRVLETGRASRSDRETPAGAP